MARIIDGENTNMVGANIAKRRRQLGLSQQELSDKLELYGVYVCRGSVSRIEAQLRTVTDIELYAISKVLKTSIDELMDSDIIEKK